jgi:hypothetical protein
MSAAGLALLLLSSAPGPAEGIVANGGMEVGGRATATGWGTDVQQGTYEFAIAGDAHTGSRCLAIRCTGEPGWARWYTTDVFLLEGHTYEFRAWVKTEGGGAAGDCWLTGGGSQLFLRPFSDKPAWTEVSARFTATQTARVGLYLQAKATGTVFFDDVTLEVVAAPPPPPAASIPTTGAPLTGIVIPTQAGPHHGYLAVETQRVLERMTGVKLPITSADAPGLETGRQVRIGVGLPGRTYDRELAKLSDEGIYVEVSDGGIVCLGRTPRAVYYAVQELFYLLGCRWIMPEGPGEVIPRVERLDLAPQRIVHNPSFALRGGKTVQVYHYPPDMQSRHVPVDPWVDWAARNRMNALKASYPWTWDYGAVRGHQWSEWSGHTLYAILPPEKYFADHPEFYTLVGGKRTHVHSSGRPSEVCVSNPDLPRIIADRAIEFFDTDPDARRFALCAEDEPSYWCECDACKALDTEPVDWSKNGLEVLPMTDRWMYLVNRVADLVAERYPDRYIVTFAYASTRNPPRKQFPHRNVMIELTWWSRCFKHGMLDKRCEVNREGMALLNRWRKLAPVSIYGYLDYHFMEAPCPYYHPDADFYRTVYALGVRHISDEWDTTFTSSPLLLNLRARLLWDVNTDVDAYIADFCRRAYGPAGEEVQAYFSTLEQAVQQAETPHVRFNDLDKFTDEVLDEAHRHLRRAFAAAGDDPEIRARVARLQFSLLFTELSRLQQRLEAEPELYARTEPLKTGMRALVNEYSIPVILGAYNAFALSYRPPVEALNAPLLGALPEVWRFKPDPDRTGEQAGWQAAEPDDTWGPISTHAAWEGQGHEGYDGYGWYTVEVTIPETKAEHVWLLFGAVDETCRVWINGEHVGDSDGDPGVLWDKPVAVEITGKYRPGEPNRLTVRVHDSAYAGGIWKPVEIRAH